MNRQSDRSETPKRTVFLANAVEGGHILLATVSGR